MRLILTAMLLLAYTVSANAESYRVRRDAAGWSHYYDSKGSQRCISKQDANRNVNIYCR